jgi:hypothetical protein
VRLEDRDDLSVARDPPRTRTPAASPFGSSRRAAPRYWPSAVATRCGAMPSSTAVLNAAAALAALCRPGTPMVSEAWMPPNGVMFPVTVSWVRMPSCTTSLS